MTYRSPLLRTASGGAILLVLVAAWILVAFLLSRSGLVPYPWTLLAHIVTDRDLLAGNAAETLATAGYGLLAGLGAVVPLAMLGALVPPTETVVMRIAVVLNVIPTIAIAPILVVALSNEAGRVVITALQVYFPALVGLLLGLRSTDHRVLDVVTASGGGSWARFRHIRLASALPSFVSALQIAVPAAVLGSLVSEFFGAQRGLGAVLVNAQQSLLVERTWAIAVVIGLVAAVGYGIVTLAARMLMPWGSGEAAVTGGVAGADVRALPWWQSALASAVTVAVLLGGWQSLRSVFDFDPFFTKSPGEVLSFLAVGHPVTGEPSGAFWSAFGNALTQTALDAGVGFIVGSSVAIVAAAVMDAVPLLGRTFMPLAVVLRSVPLAAITPLLVLVFGRGLLGVTVVVTLVTFFPTLVTVMQGLKSTPAGAVDVVRASGGSGRAVVRLVRLVYAVPSMTAAARIAIPGAIAGATLAEWLATGRGLGQMLTMAYTQADYLTLWAGGILLALVALGLHGLISVVDRVVARHLGTTS